MAQRKRKVLVFGEKVFGSQKPTLSIDYCEVDIISFPNEFKNLSLLTDYDLVLLDYSAFGEKRTIHENKQEVFEKQMWDALDKGTCFCILHYDEDVPRHDDYNPGSGYMNEDDISSANNYQIGFRWLNKLNIRPYKKDSPIFVTNIKRNEFKLYHDRWGASKNVFEPYGRRKFDDIIFPFSSKSAIGFCFSLRRGKILYLPCQRDFSRPESIADCLTILISSTITYLTRSSTEIPSWAETPIFSKESQLHDKKLELQSKIEILQTDIKQYQTAKKLAFLSEYEFEEDVPEFFNSHLDVPTQRNETFKEDFWILNSQSEKIVIAETKSCVKGFKKSGIYSLYNHREANGLNDTFPALIIINAHLNANSWKEKIKPIDRKDYECAANNNIVLMRIEDILFLWNSIIEKKNTKEDFISNIIEQNGWIEVKIDGKIVIHN